MSEQPARYGEDSPSRMIKGFVRKLSLHHLAPTDFMHIFEKPAVDENDNNEDEDEGCAARRPQEEVIKERNELMSWLGLGGEEEDGFYAGEVDETEQYVNADEDCTCSLLLPSSSELDQSKLPAKPSLDSAVENTQRQARLLTSNA